MNKFKIKVTKNKVPIYLIPVSGAKTTTLMFMFKTGSKYETKLNSGISHFLEHMFFKGTKKRANTSVIASELDSLGCDFNAFTNKEYTEYYFKVASTKTRLAIKILTDMLLNSVFSEEEIEREKGVIIEELNMYQDNPLEHIEDVFESCLYGDSPAGWDVLGNKKTIQSFKRQDFLDYFSSQYGAKSLRIVLTGKINKADVKFLEKQILGFKDNNWQDKIGVKEKQTKPMLKIEFKKIDQVSLALGLRTVPVNHPDALKLKVLALILGGSMSSRLFIKLRERNGLAYFIRTATASYSDTGYLNTQAGVPINKTKEAIKIILAEYQSIAKEKISERELKKAKDLLVGKMILRLENSEEIAFWYARQIMLRKKIMSPIETIREIKKITALDLQKTAAKYFINSNLNLALIGKVKASDYSKILKFQ